MSEVAKIEQSTNIARIGVEDLILKGIEKGLTVDALERLLALRTTIKNEAAKEAYYSALGTFQSECPPIEKGRKVKQKNSQDVRYSYATLDDIVRQVSPLLSKNGLSYTIKTEHKDGFILATCEVHHVAGHMESSTFPVPIEKDAFMNEAQKAASAMTYAKRYAFCNAFGIMTTDQDDDAASTGEKMSPKEIYARAFQHGNALREYWESVSAIRTNLKAKLFENAAEAYMEIPKDRITDLWLAPTKGGIFTTEERELMRSPEFTEACKLFIEPESNVP